MSDAVCAFVCVCVSFALEIGVCFVLRCLHGPILLHLYILSIHSVIPFLKASSILK